MMDFKVGAVIGLLGRTLPFRGLKERADTWTADDEPASPGAQAPLAS